MQKWEYLFVDCMGDRAPYRPRFVNGIEVQDWKKGPSIYEFANQLGEQGWELVSTSYTGGYSGLPSYPRFVFKRIKS